MHTIAERAVRAVDLPPAVPTSMGLSICIPVYNEEGAIAETLDRCLALGDTLREAGIGDFEVIAVDDGSKDASAEIIRSSYPGVRLICHAQNAGYGAALKTGFAAARYPLVGFLDADATYPPEHFPALCRQVLDGADLVIGSRMSGSDTEMPAIRRLGNTFFARLLTLISRTAVSDSASGMRVFRREILDVLSPLPDGLNLTPVMSTRAVHEGITLVEVPIPYRERVGDSKLSVSKDGLLFLHTMVMTALAYNPVRLFGFLGVAGVGLAAAVLAALVALRLNGVTTLGPAETFAVFAALVCGVGGVNLFALGASFNYLVSLFYRRPIRQGLFKTPLLRRPVEQLFLPSGLVAAGLGLAIAIGSFVLSRQGWPIERLWLYLTGSAMLMLVGLQLMMAWLMAAVLRQLSERALTGAGYAGHDATGVAL